MPYRRKYTKKRSYRRRTYGRYRKAGSKRKSRFAKPTTVSGLGTSNSAFVRLKYTDIFTVGANGANQSVNQFRGNGAYDPQLAVGGATPAYWSTYAALYNRYTVFGSSCKVTFTNSSAYNVNVGVIPANQNYTPGTSFNETCEQPGCVAKVLTHANAGGSKIIKMYRHSGPIQGVPKLAISLNGDLYGAGTSGNPTREWYWNVITQNMDETNNTTTRFRIEITYYVRFTRAEYIES